MPASCKSVAVGIGQGESFLASDAMALALRVRVPIFVAETVLQKSNQGDDEKGDETERLRRWLEQVDPERDAVCINRRHRAHSTN